MKSRDIVKSQIILEKKQEGEKKEKKKNMRLKIDQILLVPKQQLRPKFTTFFFSEAELQWSLPKTEGLWGAQSNLRGMTLSTGGDKAEKVFSLFF